MYSYSFLLISTKYRTEENSIRRKVHDALLGAGSNSSRHIRREQRRKDLKKLVSNYKKVSDEEYMNSIVDFYNN